MGHVPCAILMKFSGFIADFMLVSLVDLTSTKIINVLPWGIFLKIGWNKFRKLAPILTNRDISLIRRGRLYSSCVRSSMLHGSET